MAWFHCSRAKLAPGAFLSPGGGPVTNPGFYADCKFGDELLGLGNRAHYLWLSPSIEDCEFWSAVNNAPHIYEVNPLSPPEPWGITGADGYVALGAIIEKEITP